MSQSLVQLLGEELVSSSASVLTSQALEGKTVGLYFSAHWCPPCRRFTPKLAEYYKTSLCQKGFEVVFVSSDNDEDSFKEYFAEMPWLALPYSQRDRKSILSQKFDVDGIPTLVILNSEGELVNPNGGRAVMNDPTGDDFPWAPKPFSELIGSEFVGPNKLKLDRSAVEGKVLGLYFSAHWCPPCRAFTPVLAEWYTKVSPNLPDFQVVFISSDNDEEAFQDYFSEMPWIAVPYEDRAREESLSELLGVSGIPTLVIVDKDGTVINSKGRSIVQSDPTGKEFPWHPSPVKDLALDRDGITRYPSLVVYANAGEETREAVRTALLPVAEEVRAKAKETGETPLLFFIAGEDALHIQNKLRGRCGKPILLPKHKHPLTHRESGQWCCDGCGANAGDETTSRWNCKECDFDFCDTCNSKATDEAEPISGVFIDLKSEVFHSITDADFTSTESLRNLIEEFMTGKLPLTPLKDED